MTGSDVLVQIDRVESKEREARADRKAIAKALLDLRAEAGLTLRAVAPHVHTTAATVHNIEHGKTWKARTARALARFYGKQSAA